MPSMQLIKIGRAKIANPGKPMARGKTTDKINKLNLQNKAVNDTEKNFILIVFTKMK